VEHVQPLAPGEPPEDEGIPGSVAGELRRATRAAHPELPDHDRGVALELGQEAREVPRRPGAGELERRHVDPDP
jgi:hypothetical protein